MKTQIKYMLVACILCLVNNTYAQLTDQINPDILNKTWPAYWITCPDISGQKYGVYLFRKTFTPDSETKQFIIHVSADNRYKLYLNGKYICNGPARGDLLKWRFESLDIAPYLNNGENVITAIVWNFAGLRPMAQFSSQTGFILQGNTKAESIINTNNSWRVLKDTAYSPLPVNLNQYYVVGPGERFISQNHPWNWMSSSFDDSKWKKARETEYGTPLKSFKNWGSPSQHVLVARDIPLMEERQQRFSRIRRSNPDKISDSFLKAGEALVIPAHTKIKILIDQDYLTNAYPALSFSEGHNSIIKLTYAESLFNNKMEKGNRNVINNKKITGNQDIIIGDGGNNRIFQTLWWRTFRYVEMDIETASEPLTINDFHSIFSGYPFAEKASFSSDDPLLKDIWNTGWRTQRLCAGETYFDCPYYEQLQYAGDTRIQSLVSTYVSGDSRLMHNAIASLNDSRLSLGLTQSRYPSYQPQIIPPFSLIWITMIHDYWMICDDTLFIKSMIPGIIEVLNWYKSRIGSTGMLGRMEWWNFVDWVNYDNWIEGVPPGVYNSHSSIISLQYVYTLQKASDLLNTFNFKVQASQLTRLAENVKQTVYRMCYDRQKGLIADSPEKINFSQHANILAVLTDTFSKELQPDILNKIINDKDIAQCSYYYNFYLTKALEKAGLSDQYTESLDPWKHMLQQGLTTFAEEPEPSRSDCHAWSASPVYYFLSLVCGIKPAEPGFKSVKIEPHPGHLKWIKGSMPHPAGMITVDLRKDDQNALTGEVILPQNLPGIFSWHGKSIPLKGGVNLIQF